MTAKINDLNSRGNTFPISIILGCVFLIPFFLGVFTGLSASWTGALVDSGMIAIPLYALFSLIIFICVVMPIAFSRRVKRWWVKSLIVVFFLLGIPLLPLIGLVVGMLPADYIHLLLMYPTYKSEIASQPGGANSEMKFRWASTGLAGIGASDSELVYDPTEQLDSQQGVRRMPCDCVKGAVSTGTIATRHLFGHFYVMYFDYD